MKYLGIDFGTRRLGIAISDEAGSFAFPREVIPNTENTLDELVKLIEAEHVGEVVVGDTLAIDGSANLVTARAEEFMDALAEKAYITVHRAREAFSSAEAMRYAPVGKKHDDSAAAAIILQRFLDARPKSE